MKHFADNNKSASGGKRYADKSDGRFAADKKGGKRFADKSGGSHYAEKSGGKRFAPEKEAVQPKAEPQEPVAVAEPEPVAVPQPEPEKIKEKPAPKEKKRKEAAPKKQRKEKKSKEAAPKEPLIVKPEPKKTIEVEPLEEEPQKAFYRKKDLSRKPPGSEYGDISSSSLPADGQTRVFPMKKAIRRPERRTPPKTQVKETKKPKRGFRFPTKKPRTDLPSTPTAPEPAMKAGYAPAFLFGAFLAVMAIWFIAAPKLSYSASEKRVLSGFPTTNAETVFSGEFGKEFETYFADHFPLRNLWVGVNAYTEQIEGLNGKNGVYNGRDGYLINTPVPTENQIVTNLRHLSDFKEEIGNVPMTVMMVPSTGYICEDKLPLMHGTYHDDQYFDYANAWMTEFGVKFLDLREPIRRAYQSGTQMYYKTDHHWTTAAAYVAYREYCKTYGLVTKPEEGFEVEPFENFYGTTYAKSGLWLTAPDTLEVWKNPNNGEDDIHVTISDGDRVKESSTMFFKDHAYEDDKYPVFLDGNHAKTIITNENANKGTVVVIKDSFAHCFAPFLSESFNKVIMVDMRYNSGENIIDLVKNEKAEQVLVLYGMDNFVTDTELGHLWG